MKSLSPTQRTILQEIAANDFFSKTFCFTGGTALSACYLQHRYSNDLDFFSLDKFSPQTILININALASKHNFMVKAETEEETYIYFLKFKSGEELKLDFVYQPYPKIEAEKLFEGVKTDSLIDIATNKLLTIIQRNEVKDFVDLFFLLKQFDFWTLREKVMIKYRVDNDQWLYAADFMKSQNFDVLPKMIKPLTIEELKEFFKNLARGLTKERLCYT